MKLFNYISLYAKFIACMVKKDTVTNEEYGKSYDEVASTYEKWVGIMGKHVKPLIKTEFFSKEARVIDLACGTGFISRELLSQGYEGELIGIDISEMMIKKCHEMKSDRVNFIQEDAIKYLEDMSHKGEHVDGIYLGWALPYLEQKRLIEVAYKVLKPGGYFITISNCKGTLVGVEKTILEVMMNNIHMVSKPMEAKVRLPKDEKHLGRWFKKRGFKSIHIGEGEEWVCYKSPEKLYQWLRDTGVLAGVDKVFYDVREAEDLLIEEFRKSHKTSRGFEVNHKFVYGIFRKEGGISCE
ncbi:class I SAM-dependent DNA methyltransferase [Oceanirhabdus seepicola]|uniref:Methyltransferase domain-containing protein n=1 Tax=Oceanirhabdus seepicola TaxID=2828781 RepID=A0A9J6P5J3_9CLOT|nr:class I SAM-dependent methyltransferase [Oceanirhabdus seepicola]MCM1991851.1 methyltransferase domain-containing protein [Oceanirhabdus seepicola]